MNVYPIIHFDPDSGETTITTIADNLETALAIAEAEAKRVLMEALDDDPDGSGELNALKDEKGFEISIDGLLLEKWSVWEQPVRTSLAEWLATWEPKPE